jgi:hypothetical protein
VIVPVDPGLIGAGRSLVQWSPIVGPDWATLSVAEMSEGFVVVSDEVAGCAVALCWSSMASDSGALVASSGSDDMVLSGFEGPTSMIARLLGAQMLDKLLA